MLISEKALKRKLQEVKKAVNGQPALVWPKYIWLSKKKQQQHWNEWTTSEREKGMQTEEEINAKVLKWFIKKNVGLKNNKQAREWIKKKEGKAESIFWCF